MDIRSVKIRAVIVDVYGTMLQVGPPPADAATRWQALFQEAWKSAAPLSLLDFSVACNRVIHAMNSAAQTRGIPHPEVLWPSVVEKVLPEFKKLSAEAKADFIFRQMQLGRTTRLAEGAGETLKWLSGKKILLGIVSNAQAYSLRELEAGLTSCGLSSKIFNPDLCFWSYQHGFSKPDPHVFQTLRTWLDERGVTPAETLIVGDRMDHDIEPGIAAGFQTWNLSQVKKVKTAGDWKTLRAFLDQSLA